MDIYRDEFDKDRSLYSRDRAHSYDYDNRELDYHHSSYPPPLPPPPLPPHFTPLGSRDDPFSRRSRLEDLEARLRVPLPPLRARDAPPPIEDSGAITCGSAVIIPLSPFEPKPKVSERPPLCKAVFVGGLPDGTTEKILRDVFSKCGEISEVRYSDQARGRNFAHVHFNDDETVEKALGLSGCYLRVGPLSVNITQINVDYAHHRVEFQEQHKKRMTSNTLIDFNNLNASQIGSNIRQEDGFSYAAKNIIHWLEKGSCTYTTNNTIFGLISNVNGHLKKMNKTVWSFKEEASVIREKRKRFIENAQKECKLVEEVFEAATQKPLRFFTKAQRKTITQWKEQSAEQFSKVTKFIEDSSNDVISSEEPPPAKVMKLEGDAEQLEANLERAEKEIQQLKIDREVAVEKKDKQILQLKTLLAKFKKTYPEEWDKALGTTSQQQQDDSKNKDKGEADDKTVAMDEVKEEESTEVIDGVNLDDLNVVMAKDASENSLAEAAAAYAQMRQTIGSATETTGLGLSEADVAIVSVMATFLTVHPLGSTMEEITSYFQSFNPSYNSYYLESLLRRLPTVFQLSGGGVMEGAEGEADSQRGKWWFLGFQTCYSTAATPTAMPTGGQEQNQTANM